MVDRSQFKKILQEHLAKGGVEINGSNPWDFQVKDERVYERILAEGSLGIGESYMDGWWDTQALDELSSRVIRASVYDKQKDNYKYFFTWLKAFFLNRDSKRGSLVVGRKHYDLGNDLFRAMLDKRMVYSCGYWKHATNLEEAQEAKLDLICKKIDLKPGMKVLDIGCGWGGFAKYAAEKYSAEVVGITISQQQQQYASGICQGLPVEIRFQDYRDITGNFDRVVSVGQIEHVGYKNYRVFFKKVNEVLRDDGMFLLHTIGGNVSKRITDLWIHKYIFPNGLIPSIKQLAEGFEGLFVMEDWHNFGPDYDKTLLAWFHNFDSSWETLKKHYDERFYRMWKYYLLAHAGPYRARSLQLWQIVLTKNGIVGGYNRIT